MLDLGDDALRAVRRQAGDECRWAQGIDEGQAGSLTGGVDAGDVGDEVVGRFGEHRSRTVGDVEGVTELFQALAGARDDLGVVSGQWSLVLQGGEKGLVILVGGRGVGQHPGTHQGLAEADGEFRGGADRSLDEVGVRVGELTAEGLDDPSRING